jgi:P63C domain
MPALEDLSMDEEASGKAKGGVARAKSLSAERRSEIAKQAAQKRWTTPGTPANAMPSPDGTVPELFAKLPGVLDLGGAELDVYILSNGERVISLNKVVRAISGKEGGNLGEYIGVSALKPFIDKDLLLGETRDFSVPGTQFRGRGITAEHFLDVCRGYVAALQSGALNTDRQREIAIQCSTLLSSCAKVGLIALIDEATGYQYERAEDALQVKLRAFIADELRAWEKTFPDELWEEFGRLTNWQGSLHTRPKWWGKLVIELIYDTLDPDVAEYLKNNKPPPGVRWHRQLTENIGIRALVSRCYEIIGMAKDCRDMRELRDKVARHYGRQMVQFSMSLPMPDESK